MTYCEGAVAQAPFRRNSPNFCSMCQAGRFLLYPKDPLLHKGTKAIACVKAPNTTMINCLVGHAYPKIKSLVDKDGEDKPYSEDPNIVKDRKLTYRCYVCAEGHPSKDLLGCVKPRGYTDYNTVMNVKPFTKCSHGVRPAKDAEGFCALCLEPVYSVVGDRNSQDFGQCLRIQDDNKGCAKRLKDQCVYCDHYRGYFMTFPNICSKKSYLLKLTAWLMGVYILMLFNEK